MIALRGQRLKSSPGEKPHFTNVRHVRLVRYGNTLAGIRRMRLDSGTMRNNTVITVHERGVRCERGPKLPIKGGQ